MQSTHWQDGASAVDVRCIVICGGNDKLDCDFSASASAFFSVFGTHNVK